MGLLERLKKNKETTNNTTYDNVKYNGIDGSLLLTPTVLAFQPKKEEEVEQHDPAKLSWELSNLHEVTMTMTGTNRKDRQYWINIVVTATTRVEGTMTASTTTTASAPKKSNPPSVKVLLELSSRKVAKDLQTNINHRQQMLSSSLGGTTTSSLLQPYQLPIQQSDANNNTSATLRLEAIYSFQGDPNQGQISFPAGTVLIVDEENDNTVKNGWIWVRTIQGEQAGWCPLSYLSPETLPPADPPPPPPSAPITDTSSSVQGTRQTPSSSNTLGQRLSDWGTNLQTLGSNAGSAITSSATKAGSAIMTGAAVACDGVANLATETKYRIQDMQLQQQQQQPREGEPQPPTGQSVPTYYEPSTPTVDATNRDQKCPATTISSHHQQHPQQRTPAEQVAVNAANGAARWAVIGGVCSGVFQGPQAAIQGAKQGAVYGGAVGATQNWKPFG